MNKKILLELKEMLYLIKKTEKIDALKCAKLKEAIHPLLLKLMSAKTTGQLYVDGNLPQDENCLIVANHQCIEDIPTLAQAVKEHFYLLVSDEDKNTLDGLGLTANGVQWVCRTDKESRIESSHNAVSILKGGNFFAMYPEATWNLSPNQLILQMNFGCIRIALDASVPIVPVITFLAPDARITKIGEKFYPDADLEKSISNLRDIMATLYYESMQKYYKMNQDKPYIHSTIIEDEEYFYEKRSELDITFWQNYVDTLYEAYARARKDKNGVREFESQFIFTPKTDEYNFFQIFNSIIKTTADGKLLIKRISSENKGLYSPDDSFREYFEFGYNEHVLKKNLLIQ